MATAVVSVIDIGDEWDVNRSNYKWASVGGADGCIYGIPHGVNRVVRFNPATQILTTIGMDLGDGGLMMWNCGVLADNGFVYSAPYDAEEILKIDTNPGARDDTAVSRIDVPDGVGASDGGKWMSGAKAADGTLYFMPSFSTHILRIDPSDDSVTRVGNHLGGYRFKYSGTVATPDGCVYGIPLHSRRIIKFDPTNPDVTTTVGQRREGRPGWGFGCDGGVLAGDNNIYAVAEEFGGILKIDVSNDTYSIIELDLVAGNKFAWGYPIRGQNNNVLYFPPTDATRVMVFDTITREASLIGPVFPSNKYKKWKSGALASNGMIYCIQCAEESILKIDSSVIQTVLAQPVAQAQLVLPEDLTIHAEEIRNIPIVEEIVIL